MEFTELTDIETNDFAQAMDIYSSCFPENERHPIPVIRKRVQKGLNKVYVSRVGSDIAFMALLWPLKNTDFILLDYMATSPLHRGRNIASDFLRNMKIILEERKQYFILEVERPGFGDNSEERQKREIFYRRNGAKELKDVTYILPPLQGSEPTEMMLMIFPDYHAGEIDAAITRALIVQIYKELYGRAENDSFLLKSVSNLNTPISLI